MKIIIISVILILFFVSDCAFSQSATSKSEIQDSLSKLSTLIWKQKTDSDKLQVNTVFFTRFQSVLESGPSGNFAFDSIYGITRVASADGSFGIYTWNVPLADGTNKYFGFIEFKKDKSTIIPLQSKDIDPTNLDSRQLTPQEWYGAIYYNLIEVETGGQKAYTLLGWDGFTSSSNRKFIDIISVDNNGNILFGKPVFKTDKGIKNRVIIEYAEKATMLLRYDYQSIIVEKRKKLKKENTWLIVMDRMIPMDPSMKGFRKYYVPAGDAYDGYIFRNGFWTLAENIDVANNPNLAK